MNVYLAAPYVARERVRQYADQLTRVGFVVTSSWLTETHDINAGTAGAASSLPDEQVVKHARDDIRDIGRSRLLVLFTPEALGLDGCAGHSGGRHVETGYALGMPIPVVVVGTPENVFHRLGEKNGVLVVPNWQEALVELSSRLVTAARLQNEAVS